MSNTAVSDLTPPYPPPGKGGAALVAPAAFAPPPPFAKGGIKGGLALKVLLSSAWLALLLIGSPAFAAAAPAPQSPGVSPAGRDVLRFLGDTAERAGLTADADADTTDVYDIIAAIINTVLGLTGIIFFIQVFWAGFRWMTAGGAEETITTAKKTIVSSVIGIAIALSAFVITNFVLNKIEEINSGTINPSADTSPTPTPGGPAPGTDNTGTDAGAGAPAETQGWCQVVTLAGADESQDIFGECYQATQEQCNQAINTNDPPRGRWSTIRENCR